MLYRYQHFVYQSLINLHLFKQCLLLQNDSHNINNIVHIAGVRFCVNNNLLLS